MGEKIIASKVLEYLVLQEKAAEDAKADRIQQGNGREDKRGKRQRESGTWGWETRADSRPRVRHVFAS